MSYIPFLYMNDVLRLSVYCRCCCCCCCTVRPGCHSNRQYYSQLLFLDSNIYNNQAHYRFNLLNTICYYIIRLCFIQLSLSWINQNLNAVLSRAFSNKKDLPHTSLMPEGVINTSCNPTKLCKCFNIRVNISLH